jgi:hypothetical protein
MSVPFDGQAEFYHLSAQLQGAGSIKCKIVVTGPGDAPLTKHPRSSPVAWSWSAHRPVCIPQKGDMFLGAARAAVVAQDAVHFVASASPWPPSAR